MDNAEGCEGGDHIGDGRDFVLMQRPRSLVLISSRVMSLFDFCKKSRDALQRKTRKTKSQNEKPLE